MRLQFLLIPFLLICVCCNFACAVPIITPETDTHIVLDYGESFYFNYSSSEAIDTSHYYLNGVESTTGEQYKVYNFAESGYNNVSVYAENVNGDSNLITWRVTVKREIANDEIEEFSEDGYNNIMTSLMSDDWEGLAEESTVPYTDLMGKPFYLVLFLLPFVILWVKQQALNIPVALSMIIGSVVISFMPEQYKQFLILMIIMSFGVNLYMLGRDRV